MVISDTQPQMMMSGHQDMALTEPEDWFSRFLFNLLGYMMILLPMGLLVYMVKNKLCLPKVQSSSLIRIFVFGKELSQNEHMDVEHQYEKDDEDAIKKSSPTIMSSNNNSFFEMSQILKLMYCFAGLQSSFLVWGVLQEKIMTSEYHVIKSQVEYNHSIHNIFYKDDAGTSDQHNQDTIIRFRDSQFLVLVNRILALVFSVLALVIMRLKNSSKWGSNSNTPYISMQSLPKIYLVAPLYEYSYCSLSNVLSSWCQYEALKFVNFPTQVLSKACKILPVMLMSQVVSGKKYKAFEYIVAVAISVGMFLFLVGNHQSNSTGHDGQKRLEPPKDSLNNTSYSLVDGLIVLSLYLTFDSFTSNWQERLNQKYRVSTAQMMAAVNSYSILLTVTSLMQQNDLMPAIRTVFSSESLATDCILLSICSASGQLFIFYTISTFGALIFTFIMTLRQCFAIILSCLIYGHSFNYLAVLGILIVFTALFSQIYLKRKSSLRTKDSS